MALLIAVLFASWSLGTRCRYTRAQVLKFTEECISAMGMTLLIVGGGGGFAKVLTDAGVAEAIGRGGEAMHLPPLLYGWLLAVFIRVATGSATVAITTASGLLVPVLAHHPEFTANQVALIIVAMGCGSLFMSHLNDSGLLDREGLPGPQRVADAAHVDRVRDHRRRRRHAAVAGRVPADLAGLTARRPTSEAAGQRQPGPAGPPTGCNRRCARPGGGDPRGATSTRGFLWTSDR